MSQFQRQNSPGLQQRGSLSDQRRVNLRADFAAEERRFRFVLAHFARKRRGFPASDVGWIAGDEVEGP